MKVLLTAINARYIHSNLAVYSLKAYANREDINIEIFEYTINHYVEDILQDLYKQGGDVLCFSCYIWNIDMVISLAKEIHKLRPDVPIWVGGPEVSHNAYQVLSNHKEISIVMMGEGEQTFLELLEMKQDGSRQLSDIKGIAYRKEDGSICINEPREVLDMSTIPFVYQDDMMKKFENKIIYYETSRGCPFACSYCLSSVDRKVRFRKKELVEQELQFFLDHKVKQVKFVDRTFNCHREHARNIWEYITKHDNGVTNFHFEVSADILKEEDLILFQKMRPGLIQLEIGVQSTYEPTIKEIDRTMNLERLKAIVEKINSYENIHQHLDLIVGLPYETYERFIVSFNDVHAMNPNQLQLGFLKVLKGSKMHRLRKEYGIAYWDKAPYEVLYTNWVTFDEVLRLKGVEEMVEVYYNSNQYVNTIRYLLHFFESPYAFYDSLARYYEEKGLNEYKHNRLARYEILMDFLKVWNEEKQTIDLVIIEDIMLYDLYLRENVKKRPYWAKDQSVWKKAYHPYYKQYKTAHVEQFQFDVVETAKSGKIVGEPCHIGFHYEERNPLTYDATTKVVTIDVVDEMKIS